MAQHAEIQRLTHAVFRHTKRSDDIFWGAPRFSCVLQTICKLFNTGRPINIFANELQVVLTHDVRGIAQPCGGSFDIESINED